MASRLWSCDVSKRSSCVIYHCVCSWTVFPLSNPSYLGLFVTLSLSLSLSVCFSLFLSSVLLQTLTVESLGQYENLKKYYSVVSLVACASKWLPHRDCHSEKGLTLCSAGHWGSGCGAQLVLKHTLHRRHTKFCASLHSKMCQSVTLNIMQICSGNALPTPTLRTLYIFILFYFVTVSSLMVFFRPNWQIIIINYKILYF